MNDDDFDWAWQKLRLENLLADSDGDAFETLFQAIEKARWGAEFTATIPMGSRGDLKCDGFHSRSGRVFQCYGPRYGQADVADALKKIDTDFPGAAAHWGTLMKEWIFVVGLYRDKVPSEIVRRVNELVAQLNKPAQIWGREQIIAEAGLLTPENRERLLGRAPIPNDMIRRVTYENIGRALAFIRADLNRSPLEGVVLPVEVDAKSDWNLLPPIVKRFLALGQTASERVRKYLQDYVEPHESDRMAEGFIQRYKVLREQGREPSQIFQQMIVFAGGATGDVEGDAAALAIVTHFFSTCQIFERPPAEQSP